MNGSFWENLDRLVAASEVVIDRPAGSVHPRYPGLVYPYDYGYLEGASSSDGHGIDVWVGSLPVKAVTGVVLTVDTIKRDSEMKLLLGCTPAEAQVILAVHNTGPQSAILVERQP
jgi:inorganic pyrophosphatase